ncbi:2'-5' RNA ligase family protein [Hyphococcus sp.]|uniref:2'-5' RNA ligase family protein n=1 Tax=Hyphococcus sp. TaxID=2038636 RepID=UPI0035C75C70
MTGHEGKRFNLFFALFPDQAAPDKIQALAAQLQNAHHLAGKPFVADRFHVSLQNLDRYECVPNEVVDSAGKAAAHLQQDSFDLTLDRAQSFSRGPGGCPLVLLPGDGVEALCEFHRNLGAALKREGLGRFAAFDFTPHLTLLYGDRLVEEHPVSPISWRVTEFSLVLSHVGQTRYDILGQWPLDEGAG